MSSERTPLLSRPSASWDGPDSPHAQFCMLVGVPPSNLPAGAKRPTPGPKTLYGRATRQYSSSRASYAFMASLSNTLLLSQVILGAALTALGASASSHILITIFGATNTVIAGLVAYLKSRGQPMRSRMFRDDVERVVDEIENSEIMWLGISEGIHGYDDIDIDDKVTVRSEVGRLTRLYERAIRNNTMNNPDNYLMGAQEGSGAALRSRPLGQPAIPVPVPAPVPVAPGADAGPVAVPVPAVVPDPDESPATAITVASPPKPSPAEMVPKTSKDDAKDSKDTIKDTDNTHETPVKNADKDDNTKTSTKGSPEEEASPKLDKTSANDTKSSPAATSDGASKEPKQKDDNKAPEVPPDAGSSKQNGSADNL